jgi:hypothetical protein
MRFAEDIDEEIRKSLSDLSHVLGKQPNRKPGFGDSIFEHLVLTQASIQNKSEESLKKEARLVCEIVVTEGACGSQQATRLRSPTIYRLSERRWEYTRRLLGIPY